MLELIVTVNLGFSLVGFFFIVRMWKEVKQRRDFYGENFAVPRGKDRTAELQPVVQPAANGISAEQLTALMQAMAASKPEPKLEPMTKENGDMSKLIEQLRAQNGMA